MLNERDRRFMERAIAIARESQIPPDKNYPFVGVVIADKQGNTVAEGCKHGRLHAEHQVLIDLEADSLQGGSAYVTLEPCSERNNPTDPSCAELVRRAGITRVFVGQYDPNPKISGRSVDWFLDNGIEVVVTSEYDTQLREINAKFFKKRRLILFDFWGTLGKKNFPSGGPAARLATALGISNIEWVEKYSNETVCSTHEAWLDGLLRHIGRTTTITDVKALKHVIDADQGVFLFADAAPCLTVLRTAGYAIGLLSNAWQFSVEEIRQLLGSMVDVITFSCEVGMRKPNTHIYDVAALAHGINIEDTVMVGDSYNSDVIASVSAGCARAFWVVRDSSHGAIPERRDVTCVRGLMEVASHLVYSKKHVLQE
jgi:HAD superfamily hydrolase (TIGR01549 family)